MLLPLTKKFKMIGSRVPVPIAETIANAVKDFIKVNNVIQTI